MRSNTAGTSAAGTSRQMPPTRSNGPSRKPAPSADVCGARKPACAASPRVAAHCATCARSNNSRPRSGVWGKPSSRIQPSTTFSETPNDSANWIRFKNMACSKVWRPCGDPRQPIPFPANSRRSFSAPHKHQSRQSRQADEQIKKIGLHPPALETPCRHGQLHNCSASRLDKTLENRLRRMLLKACFHREKIFRPVPVALRAQNPGKPFGDDPGKGTRRVLHAGGWGARSRNPM